MLQHRAKSVKGGYDNVNFPQNPLPSLYVFELDFTQHPHSPVMFRLPTHLESFIPPPNTQVHHDNKPWRGVLYLPSIQNAMQEVYCTAAETDGDK